MRLRLAALLFVVAPAALSAQARWTIVPKPIFDVGGETDDTLTMLGDIAGVARLPNGDVIAADRQTFTLYQFAPTGAYRKSIGRKGSGPGEFNSILAMMRCGDSLIVREWTPGGRWQLLTLGGKAVRTVPQETPTGETAPYLLACNPAGRTISSGWGKRPDDLKSDQKVFRLTVPFWLGSTANEAITVVTKLPAGDRFSPDNRRGHGPLPFGREPAVAIGRDRVYIGTADSFAIAVHDLAGKRIGTITRPYAPVRVTAADIERYKDLERARELGLRPNEPLDRFEKSLAEKEFAKTFPAYAKILVDADDHLWVQSYPKVSSATVTWFVFSPKGAAVAQVDLPRELVVSEIGRDYILGISRLPPDDLQHVQVYRLNRH